MLLHYWILAFLAVRLSRTSKRIFYIGSISKLGRANNSASFEVLYNQRAVTAHCDDLALLRREFKQLTHLFPDPNTSGSSFGC